MLCLVAWQNASVDINVVLEAVEGAPAQGSFRIPAVAHGGVVRNVVLKDQGGQTVWEIA